MSGKQLNEVELTPAPANIDQGKGNPRRQDRAAQEFFLAPDGSRVARILGWHRLAVWDAKTGQHVRTIEPPTLAPPANPRLRVTGFFSSFLFSPSGHELVALINVSGSGSGSEIIHVYDLSTGENRRLDFGATDTLGPWAISPDGKTLAIGISIGADRPALGTEPRSSARVVRLIPLQDSGKTGDYPLFEGLTQRFYIWRFLFAPDGQSVYFCTVGTKTEWGCVSLDGKKPLHVPANDSYEQIVTERLALSHDGRTVAAISAYGIIRIWDATTGNELTPTDARASVIATLAFDDDSVVTAARDGTIQSWDARTGRLKRRGSFPVLPFAGIAMSPNGRWLVQSHRPNANQGEQEASVVVSDPATGEVNYRLKADANWDPLFTRRGTLITVQADNSLKEWDLTTGKKEELGATITPGLHRLTNDETFVTVYRACVGTDIKTGRELFRWDLPKDLLPESVRLPRSTSERKKVTDAAISSDGKLIALEVSNVNPRSQRIVVAELQNGKIVQDIDMKNESVNQLTFSPDGKTLVTATIRAQLWDVASGKPRRVLDGHSGVILAVAFNRDGTRLATGSADGTVLIWDTSK